MSPSEPNQYAVDSTEHSRIPTDLDFADLILKLESGRPTNVDTLSKREYVLRMTIIRKAFKMVMDQFDEMGFDPEEYENEEFGAVYPMNGTSRTTDERT